MMKFLSRVVGCALFGGMVQAADLPEFDFTRPSVCEEWGSPHHITRMGHSPSGLEVVIDGEDPYFFGPARDYPQDKPLWLIMKIRSEEGGPGQVFYFRDRPTEENSVRFLAEAGKWSEVRMGLPPLGSGYRLRIDPPGRNRAATIASIRFASAASLAPPVWPLPAATDYTQGVALRSGSAALQVAADGVCLLVDGKAVARSHTRPMIGYTIGETMRWMDVFSSREEKPRIAQSPDRIQVVTRLRDKDGGDWRMDQIFSRSAVPGVFDVEVTVQVAQDRAVAFLPLLLLVAEQGGAGQTKQQALFAGLEYLENEPSSSEADLVGPESKRQVPSNHKITFPLMAILRDGRYAGLIWEQSPQFSALFDSPDRVLNTGGDVMGVLFPGSDGFNRREGSVMPMRTETLPGGQRLLLRGQLIAGTGASVIPAVQQYVQVRGLPEIVPDGYSANRYAQLAAHGWLDSKIRENNLFRHAFWQGFGAQPAADAAMYMDWLAANTGDAALRRRLQETAQSALSAVAPQNLNHSAVSHVRYPVQTLVYGQVATNLAAERTQARDLLRRFEADGSIPYRKRPNHEDYGRTHFAPDANGLTAQVVATLLESAAFAGDRALIAESSQRLRGLNRFRNTVPRGAQTWEVPLHTPDILASAHLVRAYTIGYELSGDRDFLEQALYWAWTGVPFTYLIKPVGFPEDRPYGTIAVYGATSWRAPVWFGRPVQWCGLVYADALYRLVRHDPTGPWRRLADGITSVGMYYSWPPGDKDRQGLLPDVWEMLSQRRDGPAINPGTVQANAMRLLHKNSFYDFHAFRPGSQPITVHAPGDIVPGQSDARQIQFVVRAWPQTPYYILINGLTGTPDLTIDGKPAALSEPNDFQEKEGRLILKLSGQPSLTIRNGTK